MFKPEKEETERTLYRAGLAACACLAAACLARRFFGMPEEIWAFFFACPIYRLTGYYCLGCGGTRAFLALLEGRLWDSFLYHPAVCLGTIWFAAFMASGLLHRVSRGRIPRVRFRMIWLYALIALVLVNFFVKNWLHYQTGMDILNIMGQQ